MFSLPSLKPIRIGPDRQRVRKVGAFIQLPAGQSRIWHLLVFAICLLVLLPILAIFILALAPSGNIWPHLFSSVLFDKVPLLNWIAAVMGALLLLAGTILVLERVWRAAALSLGSLLLVYSYAGMPGAVPQTLTLMTGVGALTLFLGTVTAWLVTMYRFPGRQIFEWLLLIPLAMPTYIIAFCYVELLDYSSTIQTGLRGLFGFQSAADYWFPHIRSDGGAIFVMSFVLYPYVYLTARASFTQQSICVLEVARTLGRSPLGTFIGVALPLARPALVAGVALALMECLNDIGAVDYFGVNTLTVSIYSTWLERSSLSGAAQIASIMLLFVFTLFLIERMARSGQGYHHTTGRYRAIPETRLEGWKGWAAAATCFIPVLFGFILPVSVLVQSAYTFADESLSGPFWAAARNSLILSAIAAFVAVLFALILAYARRVAPTHFVRSAFRITGLGYAVPGTVLAVGLLIPLASFDNQLDAFMRSTFGISTGLLLSGSAFAIILAYTVRFLSISNSTLEAGLNRISPNLDAAARSLGASASETLRRVHFPLLRPALGSAALLVFVDAMKELPATLLLRPFNFETLATHVYNFASLEQFEEAGLAALMIVLIGLIPVILVSRTVVSARPGGGPVQSGS